MVSFAAAFFIIVFSFLAAPFSANAQIVYINNLSAELWKYNLDTHSMTYVGLSKTATNQPIIFVDMASNYKGELYGVAIVPGETNNAFYKINTDTAEATKISNIGMMSVGMTFTPDGKLYATGPKTPGGYQGFFEMIPDFTAGTVALNPIKTINGPALDDVGYNPVDKRFYMAAHYNPDLLVDIQSGQVVGHFNVGYVHGFDFIGDGEKAFACAGDSVYYFDRPENATEWKLTETVVTGKGRCWGATKLHCTAEKPVIEVNQASATGLVHMPCGGPVVLSSNDDTKEHAKYRWTITGNDLNGTPQSIVIEGKGPVEQIDVLNDARLSALQAATVVANTSRIFTARLETWCDVYERKSPAAEIAFTFDAVAPQSWEITPQSLAAVNGGMDYTYFYGTPTEFRDLGTPQLVSQKWLIDQREIATANPFTKTWDQIEVGQHLVTHEVTYQNQCVSRESRTVDILSYQVFVPSGFSPTGDGLNDKFRPKFTPEMPVELEIRVFNRWGAQIYYGRGVDAGWDGTINGGAAAELATYTYIINYRMPGGGAFKMMKGDITLVR